MPTVDSSYLAGIDESAHDYSFVDIQLCLESKYLFPHILSGQGTADICELVYCLQLMALDYGGWI